MNFIDQERLKAALGFDNDLEKQSLMEVVREHFEEFEQVIKAFSVKPKVEQKGRGAITFICEEMKQNGHLITPDVLSHYLSKIRQERGIKKKGVKVVKQTKTVPMKQTNNTIQNTNLNVEVKVEPTKTINSFNPDMSISSTKHVFPDWLPLGVELEDKTIEELREKWKKDYWDNSSVKSRRQYGEKSMWAVCEGLPNALTVETILQAHLGTIAITQKLAELLLYFEYKIPGILASEEPMKLKSQVENDNYAKHIFLDYNKTEEILRVYSRYLKHLNSIKSSVDKNEYIPDNRGENVWRSED